MPGHTNKERSKRSNKPINKKPKKTEKLKKKK